MKENKKTFVLLYIWDTEKETRGKKSYKENMKWIEDRHSI
jgi:hypothetical protein